MLEITETLLTYLHDCAPTSAGHDNSLFFFEDHTPYSFGWGAEFADECALLQVPDLNTSIASTTDDAGVVELQAGNTVVMCCESVDGLVGRQTPYSH